MNKYLAGAVLTLGFLVSPLIASATSLTNTQIQSIISLLTSFGVDSTTIANVNTVLNGGIPSPSTGKFCHTWNTDLTVGNSGDDVAALNQALTLSSIDTTGNSSKFTENSAGDVVSFQKRYGIRQTGYVGPLTRGKLNELYGCRTGEVEINPNNTYTPPKTSPPLPMPVTPSSIIKPLTVLYPTAGTVAMVGQPMTVSWMAVGTTSSYTLTYTNTYSRTEHGESGVSGVIGTYSSTNAQCVVSGKCSISWTPEFASHNMKITVTTATGDISNFASGTSEVFTINSPSDSSFLISFPQEGAILTVGQTYTTSWSVGANNKLDSYQVDIVSPSGARTNLGTAYQSKGQFIFTIPSSVIAGLPAADLYKGYKLYFSGPAFGEYSKSFAITSSGQMGTLSFSPQAYSATYVQGSPLPSTESNSPYLYTKTPYNVTGTFTNTSSVPVTYSISVPNQPAWLNTGYTTSSSTLYPGQTSGLGAYLDPATVAGKGVPGTYTTNIIFTGNFVGSPLMLPVTLKVVPS